MTQEDLMLEGRDGLPEALKVLLAAYPRQGWSADPGFDGLVRFWMERHMMFRALSQRLGGLAQAHLAGEAEGPAAAAGIARAGNLFLGELHGHHTIEDRHYFPVLAARDARIASGFALLERDHEALDGHLARFAEAANGALQALTGSADARPATEAFHAEVLGLERLLERHLTDEEDLVVPVILHYGPEGLG